MARARRFAWQGVEGLRSGRFDFGVNTTAVVYRLGDTLIDSGSPHSWRTVQQFAAEKPLRQVLLTHHHEDHSGNAALLQQSRGARVLIHPAGLAPLTAGFAQAPYQRLLFGRPRRLLGSPLPNEVALAGGLRLIPIHSPGHAPDLVCFLEPERGWLFSGDLYVGSRPRYLRYDEDLGQLLASLRRVLQADFTTLFCAHRGLVVNGRQALQDKLDFLEELRGNARRSQAAGASVRAITRRYLGREDFTSGLTLYHFTKSNLIRACLQD